MNNMFHVTSVRNGTLMLQHKVILAKYKVYSQQLYDFWTSGKTQFKFS